MKPILLLRLGNEKFELHKTQYGLEVTSSFRHPNLPADHGAALLAVEQFVKELYLAEVDLSDEKIKKAILSTLRRISEDYN